MADGKTTPRGAPKNPLQLGATFWYFRHESRVTSPPIWVQNLTFPPLSALAKAFGVRPQYDHWDSRIPGGCDCGRTDIRRGRRWSPSGVFGVGACLVPRSSAAVARAPGGTDGVT